MVRWNILRTLLWKEALRFRYNLGLLVVIGSLLALSAMVSLSSQVSSLLGQEQVLQKYYVAYHPDKAEEVALANYLRNHIPSRNNNYFGSPEKVEIISEPELRRRAARPQPHPHDQDYPSDSVSAVLRWIQRGDKSYFRIDYHFPTKTAGEVIMFHRWVDETSQAFLKHELRIYNWFHGFQAMKEVPGVGKRIEGGSTISKIVTALVIFAFYLLSFNIYITTTAEEREKKALLAIMLTPAKPLEILLAKIIFYALLSVAVAMAVVAMYRGTLLANPWLWLTIFTGAAAYVAIGTVVLCLVRRQTTINNVSMMYLIFTAVIMMLGQMLWGFHILRAVLVENYLFRHLDQIIDEQRYTHPLYEQLMITGLTIVWIIVAVLIFRNRGVRLGVVSR